MPAPTDSASGHRGVRIALQADHLLSDVIDQDFDLLVLPGGPAVFDLREKPRILDLIRRLHFANVPIGAICAAPPFARRRHFK